jgi:hypothetical protein
MPEEFVTVATFNSAMEAHLAKNLLEREGVPAILADELSGDALSGGHAHGYVKLQVLPADVERARQLLPPRGGDG